MIYALIVMFGFLLAIRGSRYAFSQEPIPSFFWIWREAVDLFLTLGLVTVLFSLASSIESCHDFVQEYSILLPGLTAYLLTRYQKKTDLFFLCVTVLAFMAFSAEGNFLVTLSWAWAVSIGIALFQTGFLGLRYRIRFSRVPEPVKGWPVFCLLASFISLALWGVGRCVF